MQLRTFTGLWNVERRLYKFYDMTLPYPVSLRQLFTFLGTGIPWVLLLSVLNVPLQTPWHVVWIAPPVIATVVGNRPIAEGKTPVEWLLVQIRFFFAPRQYARLAALDPERRYRIRAWTWQRVP